MAGRESSLRHGGEGGVAPRAGRRKQRIFSRVSRDFRELSSLAAMLVALASCAQQVRRPEPPAAPEAKPEVPPPPANAVAAGIAAGPAVMAIDPDIAVRALAAFRISCTVLIRRADPSGLTRPEDWKAVCADDEVSTQPEGERAVAFFRDRFELLQVGEGKAFVTGYFEPEIAGCRVRQPGWRVRQPAISGSK